MNSVTDVAIFDDAPIVRVGLESVLARVPDLNVCGVGPCREPASVQPAREPALLVVDPFPEPFDAGLLPPLRERWPRARVLVYTDASHLAELAFAQGAHGHLGKQASPRELVTAIRSVRDRGRYLPSPSVSEATSARLALSRREQQVLDGLLAGHRVTDIARELQVSPQTVSTYRQRLYRKLGVESLAALVRMAHEQGLVTGAFSTARST